MLQPFLTTTPGQIFQQLGIVNSEEHSWESLSTFGLSRGEWKVQKGDPIFPRLDTEEEVAYIVGKMRGPGSDATKEEKPESTQLENTEENTLPEISIDDFNKVDLRVAEVLKVERVEKADKLLKFQLDLGTEKRQVLSGIAKFYSPEELLGKKVIVVSNLKPVKLRGEWSESMILSGESDGVLKVIMVDPALPNGAKVK
jgi:methionyl-tRNA synthetase